MLRQTGQPNGLTLSIDDDVIFIRQAVPKKRDTFRQAMTARPATSFRNEVKFSKQDTVFWVTTRTDISSEYAFALCIVANNAQK
jgi:hypothetical protein